MNTSSASRSETSLGIFAINLDRSPDRWGDVERHFGGLAFPLYRIAAVDAASKDPQAVLGVRRQTPHDAAEHGRLEPLSLPAVHTGRGGLLCQPYAGLAKIS